MMRDEDEDEGRPSSENLTSKPRALREGTLQTRDAICVFLSWRFGFPIAGA